MDTVRHIGLDSALLPMVVKSKGTCAGISQLLQCNKTTPNSASSNIIVIALESLVQLGSSDILTFWNNHIAVKMNELERQMSTWINIMLSQRSKYRKDTYNDTFV